MQALGLGLQGVGAWALARQPPLRVLCAWWLGCSAPWLSATYVQLEEDAIPLDALVRWKEPQQRVLTARTCEVATQAKVEWATLQPELGRFSWDETALTEEAVCCEATREEEHVKD